MGKNRFTIIGAYLICFTIYISTGSPANFDNSTMTIITTLFKNYDGGIRPLGLNGTGPTIISLNIYLRSLEDVKETKFGLEWKPQFTLRMQWYDGRLVYKNKVVGTPLQGQSFITVPSSFNKRMWKPDLFFSNANDVKVHKELTPNEYFRIFSNGEVLYSVRLTVSLICPMDLQKFPHDKQTCVMRLASYGYTTDDIIFNWKLSDPIQVSSAIHLPNFILKEFTSDYCDAQTYTGVYSCLRGDFKVQRVFGIYFDKIYIPLLICVFIAWASFWLHPVRSSTCRTIILLACLFYAKNSSDKLKDEIPTVSYATAFDRWFSGCCFFILVGLCEFIVVSYLGTRNDQSNYNNGPGLKNHETELKDISLTEESSQAQPQHGDINLLRKLHLQTAYAKVNKEDWYMEKIDVIFRIIYPISFVMFVIIYSVNVSGD